MYIEILIQKLLKNLKIKKLFLNKLRLLVIYCTNLNVDDNLTKKLLILKNLRFFQLKTIVDVLTIDWLLIKNRRFELLYLFLSIRLKYRLIFSKLLINDIFLLNYKSMSIEYLYKGAGWLERENWDLFGIFFYNNCDLRRILTDYGFEGFPMRKDFPLTGFIEVRYDDEIKMIIYEKVELAQEFRYFELESSW